MRKATTLFKNIISTPTNGLSAGAMVSVGNLRVQIVKQLAQGGFAFVYLVKDVQSGEPYALKRLLVNDRDDLNKVKEEIEYMKTIPPHKNIVKYLGSNIATERGESEVYIVMEFCSGSSLYDILHARYKRYFAEHEVLDIFFSICEGVAHIHAMNPPLAHRDIKVENVLFSGNNWKLCDFGSATTKTYQPQTASSINFIEDEIGRYTTMAYRSPEMIDLWRKELINEKVDVWALGCLLYRICFFHHPFEDGGNLQILNVKYQIPPESPYSDQMHKLISYLIEPDPGKRPNVFQVLQRLADVRGIKYTPPSRSTVSSAPSTEASSGTDVSFFNSLWEDATAAHRSTSATNLATPQKTASTNSSPKPKRTLNQEQNSNFADFDKAFGNTTISATAPSQDTSFFAQIQPDPASVDLFAQFNPAPAVSDSKNVFDELFSGASSSTNSPQSSLKVSSGSIPSTSVTSSPNLPRPVILESPLVPISSSTNTNLFSSNSTPSISLNAPPLTPVPAPTSSSTLLLDPSLFTTGNAPSTNFLTSPSTLPIKNTFAAPQSPIPLSNFPPHSPVQMNNYSNTYSNNFGNNFAMSPAPFTATSNPQLNYSQQGQFQQQVPVAFNQVYHQQQPMGHVRSHSNPYANPQGGTGLFDTIAAATSGSPQQQKKVSSLDPFSNLRNLM